MPTPKVLTPERPKVKTLKPIKKSPRRNDGGYLFCCNRMETKKVSMKVDGIILNPLREAKVLAYAEKWLGKELDGKNVGVWVC